MRAIVGLGGNVGEVRKAFIAARALLHEHKDVRVIASAPLYRSRPHGPQDQPWFLNSALKLEVRCSPEALLETLLAIETRLGRSRARHWGPRTIDLDLWLVEDEVRDTPRLMLPHPRLAERRFALAPLAALWPSWRHPLLGQTALEMLAACPEPSAHIRALGGW